MDRISNLPNDVICHIVSFLSAEKAAFTKVLSKKWLNLFTIEPDLVFDCSINTCGCFKVFVDQLLNRHYSDRVRRFSLKSQSVDISQYNLVNDCLRNVLKRGVLDLELDINVGKDYPLPFEFFTCKSVVKLKLGSGFVIGIIPKNALLPALKTLILDSVQFSGLDGCVFQSLLSACPVLEELVIDGFNCEFWNWSRTVYSLTLKRLTIRSIDYDADDDSISFDTPNLEYLELCDVLRDEYPVVNLNSLVEARLDLPPFMNGDTYDCTNLIKGLKNVQSLSLDAVETLQLFEVFVEAVPVFENLFHLSIATEPYFCWSPLHILLDKSPKIKTLTIEGTFHYNEQDDRDIQSLCNCVEGYTFLMSCPLEVLKITHFKGYIGEMLQIKHVLGKLPCLVLLEVHVQARTDDEKLQIMSDLLMLSRGSAKCKVQVKFC